MSTNNNQKIKDVPSIIIVAAVIAWEMVTADTLQKPLIFHLFNPDFS